MSVADKLTYVNMTKVLIRAAIIGKGVSFPAAFTFRILANYVSQIGGNTAYDTNVTAPGDMATKLAYLYKTKQLIKNAIKAKGVTVSDNFRNAIFEISMIPVPGGGAIPRYPSDIYIDPPLDGLYPVEEAV
jgi:hypothetical protein